MNRAGLEWIKSDWIFYPTIFLSYVSLAYLAYLFILELGQTGLVEEIVFGVLIIYFIRMLTYLTGSSSNDFGFKRRENAKENLEKFLDNLKDEEEKIEVENTESKTYRCDNCGRKISKEQYERNDGRCPTCVAEDTHVAMFDSEGREY